MYRKAKAALVQALKCPVVDPSAALWPHLSRQGAQSERERVTKLSKCLASMNFNVTGPHRSEE